MKHIHRYITLQIAGILGSLALLVLCMLYPYLPGDYDPNAAPLSTMIQAFGWAGLPAAALSLFWYILSAHRRYIARIIIILCALTVLTLSIIALYSGGRIWGMLTLFILGYGLWKLNRTLRRMPSECSSSPFQATLAYLLVLPLGILLLQLILAKPAGRWSREAAMDHAGEFINQLDAYYKQHGRYPATLQAMYKDYAPQIAGIEQYHYSPYGESYNLSFEQPRFLVDNPGVREWLVYNPRDEHRVYSHTSWFLLLSQEELERSQGWYTSDTTGRPQWRYFLFD